MYGGIPANDQRYVARQSPSMARPEPIGPALYTLCAALVRLCAFADLAHRLPAPSQPRSKQHHALQAPRRHRPAGRENAHQQFKYSCSSPLLTQTYPFWCGGHRSCYTRHTVEENLLLLLLRLLKAAGSLRIIVRTDGWTTSSGCGSVLLLSPRCSRKW